MTQQKILYGIEGRNAAEAEPGMWEVQGLGNHWTPFEGASYWLAHAFLTHHATCYRRKQSATDAAIRAVQLPKGYRLEGPDKSGCYKLVDPNGDYASILCLGQLERRPLASADSLELRAKLTRALEVAK